MLIIAIQIHCTSPKIRFCTGSDPASRMMEICDDEEQLKWSCLEIRLSFFRQSTIPQKQSSRGILNFIVEANIALGNNTLYILKTVFGSSVTRNMLMEKINC